MARPRVASLLASATEIVVALGARDLLVARSHECDYPAAILGLPVVTRPRIDPARPSGEIDRAVKDLVAQALSVYDVDGTALRTLAPEIIVTQTQCEVCAVSESDVVAALGTWPGSPPKIVSLQPNALEDIFADIRRVAAALDRSAAGDALVAQMHARIDSVAAQTADLRRPRVACIEWIEPLMAAGNWLPELVRLAGGVSVVGAAGRHSAWLTLADLAAADPEIIVVMPCGFDLPRTRREMVSLADKPGWQRLRAVRTGQVYFTNANQYFTRPGPRLVDSLEMLAEMLHPARFRFGHENAGWSRADSPPAASYSPPP